MPKKKPIAKRLNKLFDDIQQVEPSAEAKSRPHPPESSAPSEPAPPPTKATAKRASMTRPVAARAPVVAPITDTAISIAFEAGQNNWSILRVADEADERK
ncbi:MAG TPA: hypothetical protein VKD65_15245, partial [Candidatus Angelobacter sp.]|nr:hypothetical protein [Candidatus Angelobacter sp.]